MKLLDKYFAEITALFVFIIYILTLAPTLVQIDSGELAAVQYILGIPHPTGYPLFTIVGYLFTHLLPLRPIVSSNILSALFCAGAVLMFAKTIYFMFGNILSERTIHDWIIKFLSSIGGLIFAFSRTFWFQSTSVEVYAFHIFLMSATIYFLLKASFLENEKLGNKFFYLAVISLALGFTNHMTTILILPGFAFLYFGNIFKHKNAIKQTIFFAIIFIVIIVTVYSYLPLRALKQPVLNWGNPIDLEKFWRHFTGRQYQVWLFSSFDSAEKQFLYYIKNLPSEFAYLSLIPAILGFIHIFKTNRKFFYFAFVSFIFSIIYSINYDIVDIDSYFLLSYYFISVFISAGFIKILILIRSKTPLKFLVVLVFPILQLLLNFTSANQSGNYGFEEYTKTILSNVKNNSVILSYQWDYFISPAYYLQFAENYKRNVKIVDKELLRRSWYYIQLENNYPDIFKGIETDKEEFLKALKPFEQNKKFDSQKLEYHYRRILTGIIENQIKASDVYIAPELYENEMRKGEFALPNGFGLAPSKLLFKVVTNNEYAAIDNYSINFDFGNVSNNYTDFIKRTASVMMTNRALYELRFGFTDRAKVCIAEIKKLSPDFKLPNELVNLR